MRMLKIVVWMVGVLILVEAGLEVRANRRGFSTIVFGSAVRVLSDQASGASRYGPTADFPFRSLITGKGRTVGVDRIWMASASYGEDTYVDPDRIFPNLAAQALNDAGYPTEILNASRAGSLIASNILFLEQHAAEWSPRKVVLYQMSLDVNLLAERLLGNTDSAGPGVPGNTVATESQNKSKPNILVRYYESSTIYKTLKELVGGRATQERILAKTLGPLAAPMFRQIVLDFVSAARTLGIEPVLCTFATSHDAHNLGQMPVGSRNAVFRYNIYLSLKGWVATIEEFNGVIRDVAAAESLQLIDVSAALGGHPEFFRDYVHFNPEGHAAFAAILAKALAPVWQAGK